MALRKSGLTIASIFMITLLWLGPALASPEKPGTQESFEQGLNALSQGNPTLAVEKFSAALKQDPEMVEAYINRGIAEMKLALWADAVGRSWDRWCRWPTPSRRCAIPRLSGTPPE